METERRASALQEVVEFICRLIIRVLIYRRVEGGRLETTSTQEDNKGYSLDSR